MFIGALFFWLPNEPIRCGNEVITELSSPTGKLRLFVFKRSCDSANEFSTQASVLPTGHPLPNKEGNLFIEENGYWGDPTLKATWSNAQSVVLIHHPKIRVLYAAPEIEGVKVHYETAPEICPNVSDYACLVKNSRKVFIEDYDQWYKIFRHSSEKAQKCTNSSDVSLFFRLWSGWTDGEAAEALHDDTENILTNNNQCFFEGWLGLPAKERTAFIEKFCPTSDPERSVTAIKQAMSNPRYKSMATQLLHRAEGAQCN